MPSVISESERLRQPEAPKMQLECLELAGCTLDRYISADNSRPSFLEITGIASQGTPTCSGLNAGDYRNLSALLNHPNLSQLKILNKVPLPPEIMEHFAHMQCHCLMGVFPEISRVWLAIDSNIYVWAFEHGSDVAYFDGLGETIVSVGLVKPKPGVFQSFVKYLLVLTTTVEIVVLGVTFSNSKQDGNADFEEIHLVPEPVFVLPTDGASMLCVKSTSNGRIFMGGKDGCLYEITYQAQLGWFGKHCKKVNHSTSALSFLVPSFLNAALYDEDPIVKIEVDNSRHILYTLSEKGCIEIFDLGADGEGISKVMRLSQGKIVSAALDIVKTLEANNFKPVIAISAVEEMESDHLNLVAVTQAGARLYFSAGSGDANQGGSQRPQYLSLLHVRLPPGFTPNASVLKPKQVHSAVYDNGTLVMVCSSGGGEAESLWCLSRALPAPGFSEAHTVLALDGPAWALTALPPLHADHISPALLAKKEIWSSSRWAVVSAWGAALLAAGAAPDLLRTLLRDYRGPEAQPVKDMFQQQLWEYIKDRRIDLIASDHSPSVASLKGPNFMTAWGGVSSVQFGLSLFWTEAKARGYSLSTVSHYLSAGPANMVGLQNRKGALKPGLDADLVFFDPEASFVVTPEIILYKNKLSPYMQRVLNGKVMKTYLRGQQIYSNGEDIQSPAGQLLINADVLSKL